MDKNKGSITQLATICNSMIIEMYKDKFWISY